MPAGGNLTKNGPAPPPPSNVPDRETLKAAFVSLVQTDEFIDIFVKHLQNAGIWK
jgi:hypothetical protein